MSVLKDLFQGRQNLRISASGSKTVFVDAVTVQRIDISTNLMGGLREMTLPSNKIKILPVILLTPLETLTVLQFELQKIISYQSYSQNRYQNFKKLFRLEMNVEPS